MIEKELTSKLKGILSGKEIEVVVKRLRNKHITQTESNYLSRSIRPKLKSAEFAANYGILSLLDYRRKKHERENSILRKKIIEAMRKILRIKPAKDIKAILLFGSYVRNSHVNYRDIDIMAVLSRKIWKTSAQKNKIEKSIESSIDIKTDVNLAVYRELINGLPYDPYLQTKLEHHELIYGKMNLTNKIIISRQYLYWKLLETEYAIVLGKDIRARYIYNAIRNCLAIQLFLDNIVNNKLILDIIEKNIGKLTADSLMDNKANLLQRHIASKYLEYLYNKLHEALKSAKNSSLGI
jgi:predicted nucleotidyltransferase